MKKSELRNLIREEVRKVLKEANEDVRTTDPLVKDHINESGTIRIGNEISDDLSNFLKTVVITKSNGYVKNERDAAALLLDVIKHRYNF